MRKVCSLTVTMLLAAVLAVQPAQAQDVEIGAEAGLNVSSLSQDVDGADAEDVFESTTGLRFGGLLRVGLGPVLGVQTGVSYSQKGADFDDSALPAGSDLSVALDYLEVPLLLNVDIPTGPSAVQPRLYAGGNLSFELACDLEASAEGDSASVDCDSTSVEDGLGGTKGTDFGLLFGGGVGIPAGPGAFNVDVRYDLGLTDILDDDADAVELKNRNVQAVAGYSISVQ